MTGGKPRGPSVQALENKTIIQSVPVPHVKVGKDLHLQAGEVQKAKKIISWLVPSNIFHKISGCS